MPTTTPTPTTPTPTTPTTTTPTTTTPPTTTPTAKPTSPIRTATAAAIGARRLRPERPEALPAGEPAPMTTGGD